MEPVLIPVSYGELLDKISILQIKSERILEAARRADVQAELKGLEGAWSRHPASAQDIDALRTALRGVNERLWAIEDDIRAKERSSAFDQEFVELARSVYLENDERARLKHQINLRLGSPLVEVKSYKDHDRGAA